MSASHSNNNGMALDQAEAGLPLAAAEQLRLPPAVSGMTEAQVASALEYAEAACHLEAFLDERRDNPATRILACFPQATTVGERVVEPFLSSGQIIKAFHHLSALEADIASLKPLAIFRIRQNPILFPSLAELSLQEIDALPKVAGFFHLTINPRLACSQQLAASALVARETDAPCATQAGTFTGRLLAEPGLKSLADSAFAHLKGFLKKLFDYQEFSLDWPGWHGPGRAAFLAGLTGEPLQAGTTHFHKGLHACGCLLVGGDLQLDAFAKHDVKSRFGQLVPNKEYAPLQMLAAALGRLDVLQSLREKVDWETANGYTLMAAAQHNQIDVAKWILQIGGRYAEDLPEVLAEGARKCGGASVPLLRWFIEEFKGNKKSLNRAIPMASSYGADPLPLLDYIGSLDIDMSVTSCRRKRTNDYLTRSAVIDPASSQLELFARIGAAERLKSDPTPQELAVILSNALSGGHTALAEQSLANGAKWSSIYNPLGKICEGHNGNVSMLSHWIARGCPCEARHLSALVRTAAEGGFPDVLAWAAAHPNFPGWRSDSIQFDASEAICAAIEADHENGIEWFTKNVPLADLRYFRESSCNKGMEMAVQVGNLRVVKMLHAWGLPAKSACFIAGAKGPSHQDIFDYIMAHPGEIRSRAWERAGWGFSSSRMKRAVRSVVEKYTIPINEAAFINGAASCSELDALEYAIKRGIKDAGLYAKGALLADMDEVMMWLFEKFPEAASALPFQKLLDEVMSDPAVKWPRDVVVFVESELGIKLVRPPREDDDDDNEDA
jgi:hypothetical protein